MNTGQFELYDCVQTQGYVVLDLLSESASCMLASLASAERFFCKDDGYKRKFQAGEDIPHGYSQTLVSETYEIPAGVNPASIGCAAEFAPVADMACKVLDHVGKEFLQGVSTCEQFNSGSPFALFPMVDCHPWAPKRTVASTLEASWKSPDEDDGLPNKGLNEVLQEVGFGAVITTSTGSVQVRGSRGRWHDVKLASNQAVVIPGLSLWYFSAGRIQATQYRQSNAPGVTMAYHLKGRPGAKISCEAFGNCGFMRERFGHCSSIKDLEMELGKLRGSATPSPRGHFELLDSDPSISPPSTISSSSTSANLGFPVKMAMAIGASLQRGGAEFAALGLPRPQEPIREAPTPRTSSEINLSPQHSRSSLDTDRTSLADGEVNSLPNSGSNVLPKSLRDMERGMESPEKGPSSPETVDRRWQGMDRAYRGSPDASEADEKLVPPVPVLDSLPSPSPSRGRLTRQHSLGPLTAVESGEFLVVSLEGGIASLPSSGPDSYRSPRPFGSLDGANAGEHGLFQSPLRTAHRQSLESLVESDATSEAASDSATDAGSMLESGTGLIQGPMRPGSGGAEAVEMYPNPLHSVETVESLPSDAHPPTPAAQARGNSLLSMPLANISPQSSASPPSKSPQSPRSETTDAQPSAQVASAPKFDAEPLTAEVSEASDNSSAAEARTPPPPSEISEAEPAVAALPPTSQPLPSAFGSLSNVNADISAILAALNISGTPAAQATPTTSSPLFPSGFTHAPPLQPVSSTPLSTTPTFSSRAPTVSAATAFIHSRSSLDSAAPPLLSPLGSVNPPPASIATSNPLYSTTTSANPRQQSSSNPLHSAPAVPLTSLSVSTTHNSGSNASWMAQPIDSSSVSSPTMNSSASVISQLDNIINRQITELTARLDATARELTSLLDFPPSLPPSAPSPRAEQIPASSPLWSNYPSSLQAKDQSKDASLGPLSVQPRSFSALSTLSTSGKISTNIYSTISNDSTQNSQSTTSNSLPLLTQATSTSEALSVTSPPAPSAIAPFDLTSSAAANFLRPTSPTATVPLTSLLPPRRSLSRYATSTASARIRKARANSHRRRSFLRTSSPPSSHTRSLPTPDPYFFAPTPASDPPSFSSSLASYTSRLLNTTHGWPGANPSPLNSFDLPPPSPLAPRPGPTAPAPAIGGFDRPRTAARRDIWTLDHQQAPAAPHAHVQAPWGGNAGDNPLFQPTSGSTPEPYPPSSMHYVPPLGSQGGPWTHHVAAALAEQGYTLQHPANPGQWESGLSPYPSGTEDGNRSSNKSPSEEDIHGSYSYLHSEILTLSPQQAAAAAAAAGGLHPSALYTMDAHPKNLHPAHPHTNPVYHLSPMPSPAHLNSHPIDAAHLEPEDDTALSTSSTCATTSESGAAAVWPEYVYSGTQYSQHSGTQYSGTVGSHHHSHRHRKGPNSTSSSQKLRRMSDVARSVARSRHMHRTTPQPHDVDPNLVWYGYDETDSAVTSTHRYSTTSMASTAFTPLSNYRRSVQQVTLNEIYDDNTPTAAGKYQGSNKYMGRFFSPPSCDASDAASSLFQEPGISGKYAYPASRKGGKVSTDVDSMSVIHYGSVVYEERGRDPRRVSMGGVRKVKGTRVATSSLARVSRDITKPTGCMNSTAGTKLMSGLKSVKRGLTAPCGAPTPKVQRPLLRGTNSGTRVSSKLAACCIGRTHSMSSNFGPPDLGPAAAAPPSVISAITSSSRTSATSRASGFIARHTVTSVTSILVTNADATKTPRINATPRIPRAKPSSSHLREGSLESGAGGNSRAEKATLRRLDGKIPGDNVTRWLADDGVNGSPPHPGTSQALWTAPSSTPARVVNERRPGSDV